MTFIVRQWGRSRGSRTPARPDRLPPQVICFPPQRETLETPLAHLLTFASSFARRIASSEAWYILASGKTRSKGYGVFADRVTCRDGFWAAVLWVRQKRRNRECPDSLPLIRTGERSHLNGSAPPHLGGSALSFFANARKQPRSPHTRNVPQAPRNLFTWSIQRQAS